MKERDGKKYYRKPEIVSEKVFEQSALACGNVAFDANPANLVNFGLKVADTVCGFSSS